MLKLIDKVAWIHIVEQRILSTRSKGKDTYYLPGGKREAGETDQQCLMREIKEELSVDLLPDTLAYVGQFEAQAHGHPAGVIVRMRCYTGAYSGSLAPAAEIDELVWLGHADREKTSPVDQIIFDWLKQREWLA